VTWQAIGNEDEIASITLRPRSNGRYSEPIALRTSYGASRSLGGRQADPGVDRLATLAHFQALASKIDDDASRRRGD
jgi:hypothetical protein